MTNLDFPSNPTDGQVFTTPKADFTFTGGNRWRRTNHPPPPMQATLIYPDNIAVNTPCPVSIYGNSLAPTCKAMISGQELATTFVSDTELRCTMPARADGGTIKVWVVDNGLVTIPPTAGLDFTYNAIPLVLTSLAPPSAMMHAVNTINVDMIGTGFNPNCMAVWDGWLQSVTYVSSTKLIATGVEVKVAKTVPVKVRDTQTQAESNAVDFLVTTNQPPALLSVSPNVVVQGTTVATLTVTGQNFVNGKRVKIDGIVKTTTYVNATTLTVAGVVAPYSVPFMAITVEDCPGEVRVTLTGAPGAVTMDALVPNTWPNETVGEPHHSKNTARLTVAELETDAVYVNGVFHDSWIDNGGLMFQASYMGGDPNIVNRYPVTVFRNGVPSVNHFVIYIGGPPGR
jgi:hypothetical protein